MAFINGTPRADTLIGTIADDFMQGLAGDDILWGGLGNDLINGGPDVDTVVVDALRRQSFVSGNPSFSGTLSTWQGFDTLSSVEIIDFRDGGLVFHTRGATAEVYRLYEAAFDRAPDPFGLAYWTDAVVYGRASSVDVARSFMASAEFQSRFPATSNEGFVRSLYINVLGREPDAAGLTWWTSQLERGSPREQILFSVTQSDEFVQQSAGRFSLGVWVADVPALDVLRYYKTVLDRVPDASGLTYWIDLRDRGLSLNQMADAFTNSYEFSANYGTLDNRGFVELLYLNALDRPGDLGGISHWTFQLDTRNLSRSDVVANFAFSPEMEQKLAPSASDGIAFA